MSDETTHSPLTSASMDPENNEYATPPKIWRPIDRAVDGFDLDPASGAESSPIAETRYTKADDGLSKAWFGNVWLNPPWSTNGNGNAKHRWLQKARSEAARDAVDRVVVLIPSDTGAHWFHDHVLEADAVCFVGPGRIPFEGVGVDRNPSFALVIAVFGPVDDELADALHTFGAVMRGREMYEPLQQATPPTATDGGTDQ
ncbi:DNA N-6-adenine-methyltransferase [Natrinema versiforme]|uniref:Uncharacterized protein n=1 Tax=Natrinema versiforme JCM 10478 TaxID=1227496 RepID=L9Y459_9EURY|nr:DNA N-6-adenine-methyltransferase [Natrinema versiforme]ELY68869.1 hypothetical protein C489_05868 [Natrinema versiforme JCM 10478]